MADQVAGRDRAWAIERGGIEPISDADRHGTAAELFWVWFAANIAILGVVYGAILASLGLNLVQAVGVAAVASIGSFALVGVLSIAGKRSGAPALTLSRAAFGVRGNVAPAVVSWISLIGWETVGVVTAAYALLGLLGLFGLPADTLWTVVSLVAISVLIIAVGRLGHATVVWVQKAATWIFGAMTLVIVAFLVPQTDWEEVFATPPGPWDSGVVAGLGLIAAGTGVGWLNAGPDYARYLPGTVPGRSIAAWTVLGSAIPLVGLITVGFLLSSRVDGLAASGNPIVDIGGVLPTWMAIPYLITAIGGLLAFANLSLYSSGLNLVAIGVRIRRTRAVLVDGVLMAAGAFFVMVVARDFVGPFTTFLQLLAVGLSAWAAVVLVDMAQRRTYDDRALIDTSSGSPYWYKRGVNWGALGPWFLGIVVGLAFTSSPWFTGPLATGFFAAASVGFAIAFAVSAIGYAIASARSHAYATSPRPGGASGSRS